MYWATDLSEYFCVCVCIRPRFSNGPLVTSGLWALVCRRLLTLSGLCQKRPTIQTKETHNHLNIFKSILALVCRRLLRLSSDCRSLLSVE
jgi:hypothetical protein